MKEAQLFQWSLITQTYSVTMHCFGHNVTTLYQTDQL